MAVVPTSYLPPESQPWGRSVDQRIAGNASSIAQAAQDASNAQRQLESSIQRLSSFYSIADSDTTANSFIEPSTPGVYGLQAFNASVDPSISVTTNTGRVLVTVSAMGNFTNSGSTTGGVYFHPECVGVDTITFESPAYRVGLSSGATAVNELFGGSFQILYNIPAGTYTFRFRRAAGASGNSVAVNTSYRAITAQVIP